MSCHVIHALTYPREVHKPVLNTCNQHADPYPGLESSMNFASLLGFNIQPMLTFPNFPFCSDNIPNLPFLTYELEKYLNFTQSFSSIPSLDREFHTSSPSYLSCQEVWFNNHLENLGADVLDRNSSKLRPGHDRKNAPSCAPARESLDSSNSNRFSRQLVFSYVVMIVRLLEGQSVRGSENH